MGKKLNELRRKRGRRRRGEGQKEKLNILTVISQNYEIYQKKREGNKRSNPHVGKWVVSGTCLPEPTKDVKGEGGGEFNKENPPREASRKKQAEGVTLLKISNTGAMKRPRATRRGGRTG